MRRVGLLTDQDVAALAAAEADASAALALASSPPVLVGHPELVPYPVTLAAGLFTDPSGWLWYAPNGGTIGNAASGSTAASAKLQKLFEALWAHLGIGTSGWFIQTSAGGASTAGASALADWNAGKRLGGPDQRGRVPMAGGQGSGLTNRAIGSTGGAETHALVLAENAAHTHPNNAFSPTAGSGVVPFNAGSAHSTGGTTSSSGSGTPHNNMQPWAAYTLLWFTGERA